MLKLIFWNKFDIKFVFFHSFCLFMCLTWSGYISVRNNLRYPTWLPYARWSLPPCMLSMYNMTDVNYRFLKIYFVRMVTGSSVWQSSFPHYYGTNTVSSELLVHSYGYLETATYFYDSLVIMSRRPIKRRLIFLSPSSESLAPSSASFVNPSICCYLALHIRHFVRHLGICNRICVKLLQLMFAVITHNSVKKTKSLH